MDLRFEIYGDVDGMEWNPSEWTDCETRDDLGRQLIEVAEDNATWGIRIVGISWDELWEQVQEARAQREID